MKLLICDDDISTVDVIQSQLDCAQLGLSQILRAYNGEAAIRIIEQEHPEVILCDIGMPKLSGIDVLKYIYNHQYRTEFCFLTCYEDFSYAKDAIRYGASNYITKPFEMDELKAAVQHMIASVRKRQKSERTPHQAQYDSVLNNVLRQISDGIHGRTVSSVSSVLERNGLQLSAQSRWYMVTSCSDITDAIRSTWSQELLMYTVGRLHDEALVDYIGSAYTLTDHTGRYLQCTCFVPADNCTEELLKERAKNLLMLCMEHVSLRPTILISDPFPLHTCAEVKEQMRAKMVKLRLRTGRILTMREADEAADTVHSFLDGNQVLMYLKQRDAEGFAEYAGTVIRSVAASTEYTREIMDNLRRELIHIFLSCLRDNGLSGQSLFEDPQLAALNTSAALSTEYMFNFAKRLYTLTQQSLRSLEDSDDIIARADAYIRAHFRENISREDVAAVACITPNYLSKQFHSKMGMNLREYINKIRIDEAKRLLLTTSLSVSEVAGMAGYDNISYFSTVFRKHTGMSPVDWRGTLTGGSHETE